MLAISGLRTENMMAITAEMLPTLAAEVMMADDNEIDPKPWLCPGGHILGNVVRRNGIRRLVIECGELRAELTGTAALTCPCGASRVWDVGEEAIRELLERRNKRFIITPE